MLFNASCYQLLPNVRLFPLDGKLANKTLYIQLVKTTLMIDAMKNELETTFHDAYKAGKVYLMAASSSSEEVTKEWVEQIKEAFPGMEVMSDYLSFGLSCHIGPDGLGIGCTCKPV